MGDTRTRTANQFVLFRAHRLIQAKTTDAGARADKGEKYAPQDFIKDPVVLEFLQLRDVPQLTEAHIETALLDHLQEFLLELGKGFSFVARQQRITIDGDHFYMDLVLYNRLLRCFVLWDLKLGKLTHQDLGQMQLYVNYDTRELRSGKRPRLVSFYARIKTMRW